MARSGPSRCGARAENGPTTSGTFQVDALTGAVRRSSDGPAESELDGVDLTSDDHDGALI